MISKEERSHLDFAKPVPIPTTVYDVRFPDIIPSFLSTIDEELGIVALSAPPVYPVQGILFGQCHRAFVPLIVSKRTKSIIVKFLYDIGSPNSYLRQETFTALGVQENTPLTGTNVSIHGTALTVYVHRITLQMSTCLVKII
eukprot:gene46830-62659_t